MEKRNSHAAAASGLSLVLVFSLIGPFVPSTSADLLPSIGDNQLNSPAPFKEEAESSFDEYLVPLSSANSPALLAAESDWKQQCPNRIPSARTQHAMASLGSDKVLLFGGQATSARDDETWVYDLSANKWTLKAPASKPSARYYHTIANIGGDQVLLFGGYDGAFDDETWVYDLSDNTWTQKAPAGGVKPSARVDHAMASIGGDQVLLFGGYDSASDDETWVYDLSANTWTLKAPASKPSARWGHSMANIGGDQVLLFSGFDGSLDDETWVYDLGANTWTEYNTGAVTKPSSRFYHAMASIGGDQVLLFGGWYGANDDETWVYDLSANTWTKKSPVSKPSARHAHAMANIGGEQVLLFGGDDGANDYDDETWVYLVSNEIFCDGFESGDLTAWDSAKTSSNDLKACDKTPITGTYSLCVKNKTDKKKFVKDDGFTESAYSAQFNLDPNGIKVKNKKKIRLVLAKGSSNTTWMEFRRKDGVYQIRAWAGLDGGGKEKTSWYAISDEPHLIELDWSASTAPAADDGFLKLYFDDVLQQELSALDNDTFDVQKIKLGITKEVNNFTEKFYLDDFKSTNGGYIGP